MKDFEKMKFLVVDDMKVMRKVIAQSLTKEGVTNISEAEDGKPAWDQLISNLEKGIPFDFIVCDWNMPQMSGIELLKQIRSNASLSKIPFLMVTAESEQEKVLNAVLAGVSNYIVKPFSHDILISKIKSCIK